MNIGDCIMDNFFETNSNININKYGIAIVDNDIEKGINLAYFIAINVIKNDNIIEYSYEEINTSNIYEEIINNCKDNLTIIMKYYSNDENYCFSGRYICNFMQLKKCNITIIQTMNNISFFYRLNINIVFINSTDAKNQIDNLYNRLSIVHHKPLFITEIRKTVKTFDYVVIKQNLLCNIIKPKLKEIVYGYNYEEIGKYILK